jgi:uncharacterized membrane protein YuzA (DUF378 family)
MSTVNTIALIFVIVGGLNWGFVGTFNLDFVAAIFGSMSTASRLIYCLVGLSAIYTASTAKNFLE